MSETAKDKTHSVYSVLVKKEQLAATIQVIKTHAKDQCMIATKEEGDKIRVEAILFALEPTGVAANISQELQDKAIGIGQYAEGKAETEIEF